MEPPRLLDDAIAMPTGQGNKINIYLKVTKTVALKVEKTEKIENLKALLHEKEGISEYVPDFFFAGNQLKNGKSLADYGVQKDSTLHVFQKPLSGQKILVKMSSNQKTIEIEARTYDTIQNIKSKIQSEEGIRPDHYALVCNGMVLEDEWTVASVSMGSRSTFHMIFNSKVSLSFSVKTANGEIVKLKVKASFTAGDVKEIVSGMVNEPVTGQYLTYSGIQLEDHKMLACYNIKEGSILEMLPPWTQIFVKTWSGKTITVDVRQCETTQDIKNKILKKLKIPNQLNFPKYARLVYAGKQLEDKNDLASYNIQNHSTLKMVLSPSSQLMERKVSAAVGSEVPISTKIGSLKAMMREKMHAQLKELLYVGRPLSDERTMAYYGMDNNSRVVIVV